MARQSETAIQKRFSDIDPFRHVNNVAQQMYFDVGKVDYYNRILGAEVLQGTLRIITVATSTSYLEQIHLEDELRVVTRCQAVGTKSITLFQQILCGDQVRSQSTSTMVAFDFEQQQSCPVPALWRENLLRD